jgi:DNA topoisomerase-1
MANELAALTEFTGHLFRHAYFVLPWFCKNTDSCPCRVGDSEAILTVLACLKKNKPMFFGPDEHLVRANAGLAKFYESMRIEAGASTGGADAVRHYARAWHHAWRNRSHLQLRGHEVRLMRFFHEFTCKGDATHLPELISMARIVDTDVVGLVRSIVPRDGWNAKTALAAARAELAKHARQLFGCERPDVDLMQKAGKQSPGAFKTYQAVLHEFKRMVYLRISELFDERNWHPTIDSATLHIVLRNEGLEDYLPYTFRGRVGVQPTGYPLTFYTYEGLELEKPPLNDVRMNVNYGTWEKDKDYGIHPVSDGAFYCTTRPQVGDSEVKYYTLEYKRRARHMKYDTVGKLAQSIRKVRRRLLKHVHSADRDTWVRALMCLIMDRRCARIGNTESARGEKKTYGITTLITKKHVHVADGQITLKYAGKHECPQRHRFTIRTDCADRQKHDIDAVIADRLLELIAEKNEYLFTRSNGKPFTPQSVNEYFTTDRPDPDKGLPEGGAGSPCTVHNLRNYHATRIFQEFAAKFARQHTAPTYEEVLAVYQGCGRTKTRRARKGILDIIAENLGNTPAICRKAYIDPREQLLFFKRRGYRPPDCLIRDVFVHEPTDPYGVEPCERRPVTPCKRKVCQLKICAFASADERIAQGRRQTATKRHKKPTQC